MKKYVLNVLSILFLFSLPLNAVREVELLRGLSNNPKSASLLPVVFANIRAIALSKSSEGASQYFDTLINEFNENEGDSLKILSSYLLFGDRGFSHSEQLPIFLKQHVARSILQKMKTIPFQEPFKEMLQAYVKESKHYHYSAIDPKVYGRSLYLDPYYLAFQVGDPKLKTFFSEIGINDSIKYHCASFKGRVYETPTMSEVTVAEYLYNQNKVFDRSSDEEGRIECTTF